MNESNEPIAAAFEEMPAALFVLSGPEHVVVAANRAARAITGNRPFIGQPIRCGRSRSSRCPRALESSRPRPD